MQTGIPVMPVPRIGAWTTNCPYAAGQSVYLSRPELKFGGKIFA
jgi:hypothetical protein